MTQAERSTLEEYLIANLEVRALAPATLKKLLGRPVIYDERHDVAAAIRSVHRNAAIVPISTSTTGELDISW